MNDRRTCSALGFALAATILAPCAAAAAPGCTWTQVSTRFSESPHLKGVWGSSPRDVWIVGAGGTIWRWNGDSFTRMVSGTTADLNTITGSGPRDVWAAGLPTQGEKRVLLHHINDWRPFSVPGQINMAMDIHGLASVGPGQMWLAGYSHTGNGLVYSNDNGRWIARDAGDAFRVRSVFAIAGLPRKIALSVGYIDSADPKMESRVHQFDMDTDTRTERLAARTRLHGLWASSQEDILVVGDGGTVLYAKNGAWRELAGGGTQDLRGIWGSSRTDVWIVGRGGTILHYDGNTVSPQDADIP